VFVGEHQAVLFPGHAGRAPLELLALPLLAQRLGDRASQVRGALIACLGKRVAH
jgi:hypothetical protein